MAATRPRTRKDKYWIALDAGGTLTDTVIVDKQGQPANLRTPSVIASNPKLVSDFLKRTDGHPWRSA